MSLPCFLRTSWKYAILFTKAQVSLRLSSHIGLNLICSPSYPHIFPLPRRPGFGLSDLDWGKRMVWFWLLLSLPYFKAQFPWFGRLQEKAEEAEIFWGNWSPAGVGETTKISVRLKWILSALLIYCLHGDSVHGSLGKDFSSQPPQLSGSLKEGQPCLPLVSLK